MKTSKTGYILLGAGMVLALAVPASRLHAQPKLATSIDIYTGQPAKQSGITIGSWGSGEVSEDDKTPFNGADSVKLTTHGRYQGARFVLNNPVDITSAGADSFAYLQLAIKLPSSEDDTRYGSGGYPGGLSGSGRRSRTGMSGMGSSGSMGGSGGSLSGGYGSGVDLTVKPKSIAYIRVVLVMDDGKRVETEMPVDSAQRVQQVWSLVAYPIKGIPNIKDTSLKVKEVHVFGDSIGTIYIGAVQVIKDETPIRVDSQPERTVAVNDTVTFTAAAEAGPTALKYEWNFGGKLSGVTETEVPEDAEGRVVKHQFRKSGDYTVILTVRDLFGVKKPTSTKTVVHVTL